MKRFFHPDDDCVLCLTDRKKSATQWTDLSKKGNHGTVYGAGTPPAATPGALGYSFDGVDDYVDAGNGASLNNAINTTFAVTGWVKSTGLGNYNRIVEKWQESGGYKGFIIDTGINNYLRFVLYNGTSYILAYQSTQSIYNNFVFFALIKTDSNAIVYINGVSVYSVSNSDNYYSTNKMYIGSSESLLFFLNGSIDEVRIYNRALSASEILNYYGKTRKFYGV